MRLHGSFRPKPSRSMLRALLARERIVPAAAPDQVVELKISLKGFTAGFDYQVEAATADVPAEAPATGE